jgi:hypothetical protein
MTECENYDVCGRYAQSGQRFCTRCAKRLQRGLRIDDPVRERGLTAMQHLLDAALSYADSDSESEENYRLAVQRLKRAAIKFVLSRRRKLSVG